MKQKNKYGKEYYLIATIFGFVLIILLGITVYLKIHHNKYGNVDFILNIITLCLWLIITIISGLKWRKKKKII